jgi:hypothetical protein
MLGGKLIGPITWGLSHVSWFLKLCVYLLPVPCLFQLDNLPSDWALLSAHHASKIILPQPDTLGKPVQALFLPEESLGIFQITLSAIQVQLFDLNLRSQWLEPYDFSSSIRFSYYFVLIIPDWKMKPWSQFLLLKRITISPLWYSKILTHFKTNKLRIHLLDFFEICFLFF